MRLNHSHTTLRTALLTFGILLFAVGLSFAQQQVNLTAGPTTTTLPDGSAVPMWGYSCGAAVGGSTATCASLNPSSTGWSPVVITVPSGQNLQINLTNNLTFANGNTVPTSLVIVGQLGGGLGTAGGGNCLDSNNVSHGVTCSASPDHSNAQAATTWPIAGGAGTTPPTQGPRVQSFATEVAVGTPQSLTWTAPRPGTYLLESGTHPSIQVPMGLVGMVVVTAAPNGTTAGTAYPGVNYNTEIPLLFSEIDPVQNTAVNAAVNTSGFSESMVWSGQPGGCGNPASATYHQCYPPAVNYTPLYYMINGVAFDRTKASASVFSASPAGSATAAVTGNLLVRMVNAGLRMHVPSLVNTTTGTASAPGFSLIAEDGNPLPGVARVQSEVFLAAGKTYDVMINAPQPGTGGTAPASIPVYDRQLSLSGNATNRDAGMLAYIALNGSAAPSAAGLGAAIANPDNYPAVVAGQTLVVSDPSRGVLANDVNVAGAKVITAPGKGTLTLNTDGTFTYVANANWSGSDSFTYCGNGATTGAACAVVTLGAATMENASGITVRNDSYTSTLATFLSVRSPGVLANDTDSANLPLTVATSSIAKGGVGTGLGPCASPAVAPCVAVDKTGAFNAFVTGAGTYSFTYKAQNSQGTASSGTATVTLTFPAATGLQVTVLDGGDKKTTISDYRWIIEEDRTFYVDPKCTTNPPPAGCPGNGNTGVVPNFATNFHTSFMPVVATGCTGDLSCGLGQSVQGTAAVCDVANGVCRTDAGQQTRVTPDKVTLDPKKRYYISILPGDAANPFNAGYMGAPDCSKAGAAAGKCGHGMGGAPIAAGQTAVTVLTQPSPYPPATLAVFVFEDDYPLNGEHDAGGGIDVLSPNEPGLGGFQITLADDAGGTGDATGQPTYDMFNMPLSNSLAGTIDPVTGNDACPISPIVTANTTGGGSGTQKGVVGMIITCPKYESDGKTLSPLAGQALVKNLYPGRYGVIAQPGADRIARGEEWLQTNTLDGQKAHDSFMRIGEPGYFQEFGPAGYHVTIGFANPKIISGRGTAMCATRNDCTNTVKGHVTTARMSRTPDERLYGSGTRDAFSFTQCYVSLGDPDGADFAFTKCASDGSFVLNNIPPGNWKVTVFDQWNDQVVDGISTPIGISGRNGTVDMGEVAAHQWQSNIYTTTFIDANRNGVRDDGEIGLALAHTNIRFRDGSYSNLNNTDLDGYAAFNEVFPLFNWYVVETDTTRFKGTGTHVVYDTGGPVDGSAVCGGGNRNCGSSTIGANKANTYEDNPLPANLSVPGAVYCAEGADCSASSALFAAGTPQRSSTTNHSAGRIDPPFWFGTYGWQGFSGQNNFLEFGMSPFVAGENGGIKGKVVYASTRPFDDPYMLVQNSWEPLVPHVTVNLYKQGFASDGVTPTLTLVDTTQTSSFDDWAQGFRSDGIPNMNCPGQSTSDPFFAGLNNQPMYLDVYNNNGVPTKTLPNNSQFKCYDGMHNWNQLQPAPYDGMYSFPSVTGFNPTTGKPAGTNCKICTTNPDANDKYRFGMPMLPAGKYVVEVVVPPGYELVKEEDKNILIGDNFIAPVTQQFGPLSNIFILPDQASVASAYNANNAQNPTQSLGAAARGDDLGTMNQLWPCVGTPRIVPDYISLFPGSKEVAPFAGATRNLCDRKEVTLEDQMTVGAAFYIFTPTHAASHFTGVITDDFTAEFDPFSPQFGEKFAPAYMPVSFKDWAGNEISRVYSDAWGAYNGLNYSTWEVNPPNPTGYAPTMMVACMNDAGPVLDTNPSSPTYNKKITDPLFQRGYSQFCYELPFMPGQTGYFDTPVVPTSAFAGGYNPPDCEYPDSTPAVSEVDGDVTGPWVQSAGRTLTINSLPNQQVDNYGYSGPTATTSPYNQQKVTRHFGFGTRCTTPTSGSATCNTASSVTIGGVPATITAWSDTQIKVTVPNGVPNCNIQQQSLYSGSNAQCGQLVITAGNGKQSIDTVTVTVGGKHPTVLASGQTIQSAIDKAQPGDLIIVPPGTYSEMLLMWKPVRLQGVGAASSVIDGNPHPAGKLDPWRRQLVCLFGLSMNGTPISSTNPYDPSQTFTCTADMQFSIDRLPLEATVGWDATLNGNLAEQLIEPTLMGAYEGAGITVLGKGVKFPRGSAPFGADVFPTGTEFLTTQDCTTGRGPNTHNPYPSNFWCNPSSIDGLSVQNSSQGGGGILVHGWAHNLQIANNRVQNNQGTLSGGITIGAGEHPDVALAGSTTATVPGSCINPGFGVPANLALPFCFDMHVNVHNNNVSRNSSLGDELFSSTPAGAGGVTFCTGSDYYKFNYNWVCGNMSTGDGAGVAQVGFNYGGNIEHNSILFNQSTNPTIATNGGGLLIMGAPDQDPPCAATTDQDCVSPPNTITPSDGTGPGLVINANLLLGNSADAGSGGGLRMQHINGNDVINFPNGSQGANWPSPPASMGGGTAFPAFQSSTRWNSVQVTNNIIADNVAGWDGGGVSILDGLAVDFINNTVVGNNSTASAGVLFNSLFAPLASTQNNNCYTAGAGGTGLTQQSCPQVAGLVSVTNSAVLTANMAASITCPTGHGTSGRNATCKRYSIPRLDNNILWQNRSYIIGVGGLGTGTGNQQNIVKLYNPNATVAANQTTTGQCNDLQNATYWDLGVRGDSSPANHSAGLLAPAYSVITNLASLNAYQGQNNTATSPALISQYCNGSRVPPENGTMGWQVPPGTNESNALPYMYFTLSPAAVTDEGNNWINLRWGPLALTNPATGVTLGNFGLTGASSAIGLIPASAGGTNGAYTLAPSLDFFGNQRKTNGSVDAGAVEFQRAPGPAGSVTGGPLSFTNVVVGTTSAAQTLTLSNNGTVNLTGINVVVTAPFARNGGTCGNTLTVGNTCTIGVTFTPTNTTPANGTVTITSNGTITGSPVSLTGTGIAAVRTATVSPTSLPFGNWATGTTSNTLSVTVTNTGNIALAGGTVTFGGGTPQPYSRNGGTCGTTLAVGASCTIGVHFAPTATGAANRTLTVGFTGTTVTPASVTLTGTGVAARAAVSISPNPLTITVATPFGNAGSGTGTVTLTNTATAGGSDVSVTNVAINSGAGSGPFTWSFSASGTDTCTGAVLAPGASCTVGVRFTNVTSATGVNRAGTIVFTDTATGNTQTGNLVGHANP